MGMRGVGYDRGRMLVGLLGFLVGVSGQAKVWEPGAGLRQVAIWPGKPPGGSSATATESMEVGKRLIGGKPLIGVYNVSKPTITVYPPKGKNTGVAVIVFPGGGYKGLAIDLEGSEVCEWLSSRGITGVLLKYRVPFSGPYWDDASKRHVQPKVPMARQDAQRAIRIVRSHAKDWKIDARKIGVLGFSAGGHMVADVSTHFSKRQYPVLDAIEKLSCRPDFAIAIYPGHLWGWTPRANPNFDLNPDIAKNITRQTPPTFLLQAQNDDVDSVNDSLVYYIGLKKAGVPTEMHLYAEGKHAFGLRRTQYPITDWPKLVETWLKTIHMTAK